MDNKIALSIDIEDWYHNPHMVGSPDSKFRSFDDFYKNYVGRYDYLTESTEKVLKILEKFGIKATFFIVADICFHYPELVKMLSKSPHEIGCHGRYHYKFYNPKTDKMNFSLDKFRILNREAKNILEDKFSKPVIGYRAPFASINLQMLDIINSLGFKYDSSISVNSFYSRFNGLDRGKINTKPFSINFENDSGNDRFIELPWAHYNIANIKVPTAGAFFLRLLGSHIISLGLKQSLKHGDTMLYFHPQDISVERFPIRNAIGKPGYFINKGEKTEKRIIKLLKEFKDRFTTCYEAYIKNKEN